MASVIQLMAALHEAMAEMPLADAPAVLAQLGGVMGVIGARLASSGESAVAREENLSLAQLAHRLGLGESTIRKMIASGQLQEGVHFSRVGRRLIFFLAAIERELRSRPAATTVQAGEAVPFVRRGRRHG